MNLKQINFTFIRYQLALTIIDLRKLISITVGVNMNIHLETLKMNSSQNMFYHIINHTM